MNMSKAKKLLYGLAAFYWIVALLVYAISADQFHYSKVCTEAPTIMGAVGEIVDGTKVTQQLTAPADTLTQLELLATTYDRSNTGVLQLEIQNASGRVVAEQSCDVSKLKDREYNTILLENAAPVTEGEPLTLVLTSQGCSAGNAISVGYGISTDAGRFNIIEDIPQSELFRYDDQIGTGKLCVRLTGIQQLNAYWIYWILVISLFVVFAVYGVIGYRKTLAGKNNGVAAVCMLYCKYAFLLKQLVSRDFKQKYKRSVLGMAWSFLNPLLTMMVQYIIFSNLFKSSTENYPVYLLIGIIFFNFFNESVSTGLMSILANATLIKKVYMPKYIYPIAKQLTAIVNFSLSLIPLLLVILITGTPIRFSMLLLVFDILCLSAFALGMNLLLATAMTFFQDTQFLWSVFSMLWMYLTPVFYTESIIPEALLPVYRLNPMYQYITFARTCIIDGIAPTPANYMGCIIPAVLVLLAGIAVFKKQQDKFVLYI